MQTRKKVGLGDAAGKFAEKYNIRKVKKLETGELLLPSGKIAGHRDYLFYYKQRYRFRDDSEKVKMLLADKELMKKAARMEQALVLRATATAGENQLSTRSYQCFLSNLRKKADKANKYHHHRSKIDWMRYAALTQTRRESQQDAALLPRQKRHLRITSRIMSLIYRMLATLPLGALLLAVLVGALGPKNPPVITFTAVFDVLRPLSYASLPDLLFLLQHIQDTEDRGRFALDVRFVITDQSSLIESAIQISMFRNNFEKWKSHILATVGHVSDQEEPIRLWTRSCAVSMSCEEEVITLHEMLATLQSGDSHSSGFYDQSYIDEFVKASGVEEKNFSQPGLQVEGTFVSEEGELVRSICEVIEGKKITDTGLCTYEGIQQAKRALIRESNNAVRAIQSGIYFLVLVVLAAMMFFHCRAAPPAENSR